MTVHPNHQVEPNQRINYNLSFLLASFVAFVLHVFLHLFNKTRIFATTFALLYQICLKQQAGCSQGQITLCNYPCHAPRFPTDLASSPLWSILTDLTRKDRWLNSVVSCCHIDKFLASLGWSNQWNDSFSAPTVIETKLEALPPSAHQPNIHRHGMLCPV